MVFVTDDLAAWLTGLLADAGRKKLTALVLGTDQERALRQAATAAVQLTAAELRPGDDAQAAQLALVVSEVFGDPVPAAPPAEQQTLLEALGAGIAEQLAVLDDASLTGTGQSSADVLGVPGSVVAGVLTRQLLREIVTRGAAGGPLFPLVSQLNDDVTHLQGQRLEGMLGQLADDVRRALRFAGRDDELARMPHLGELAMAAQIAQLRSLAPAHLLGRDQERADLHAFCLGSRSYEWWQGPPWAGKTALVASFALDPPPGVRIVAFFVNRRRAGQADSDAYTEEMIAQLGAIAGESVPLMASVKERNGLRQHLLRMAAARLHGRGEQLVLLVDGLDEDQGPGGAGGPESIASLLPEDPHDGLHVLITSRPHPSVPLDVSPSHPLRTCTIRELAPFPNARAQEIKATEELAEHLRGSDPLKVNIVGYITAARDGLTVRDLIELTNSSQPEVEGRLAGAFGRIFATYAGRNETDGLAGPVFLLGHDTLQKSAEEQLAHDLGRYQQGIHRWAEEYRARGWPADTPGYLLQPYAALLTSARDTERLTATATDAARHDRMLLHTDSDIAALTEVIRTQRLLLDQANPDLTAAAVLNVERHRLASRNYAIPVNLPAVWARLGNTRQARDLAQSLPLPSQIWAVSYLITTLAVTDPEQARGLAEEAEHAARGITDRDERLRALDSLTQAAETITQPRDSSQNLDAHQGRVGTIFQLMHEARQAETAGALFAGPEALVVTTTGVHLDPVDEALALAAVTEAMASTGSARAADLNDRAELAAAALTDPEWRAEILIEMAAALAEHDPARATRLADQAARSRADIDTHGTHYADELSDAGLWDAAIQVARANPDPGGYQVSALIGVASALANADPSRAGRLAEEALSSIDRVHADSSLHLTKLAALSRVLARVDPERAASVADEVVQTARRMSRVEDKMYGLLDIAITLAATDRKRSAAIASEAAAVRSGRARIPLYFLSERPQEADTGLLQAITESLADTDPGRAAKLAEWSRKFLRYRDSRTSDRKADVIFAGLCADESWDAAAQAACAMEDLKQQVTGLAKIATALAVTDRRQAAHWSQHAEEAARRIAGPIGQDPVLRSIAETTAADRLRNHAEKAAGRIDTPWLKALTLAVMARQLTSADTDRAARLAERAETVCDSIDGAADRAIALASIAAIRTAAEPGIGTYLARAAEEAAGAESDDAARAVVLAYLAAILTDTDPDRATRLARAAEEAADAESDDAARAVVLACLAAILTDTDPDRAVRAAAKAEDCANAITSRPDKAQALADIAEALADTAPERATRLAQIAAATARADRSVRKTGHRSPVISRVAWALAVSDSDRQARFATDVTSVDSTGIGMGFEANVLALLAEGLAAAKQYDAAEQAARATGGGSNFFAYVAYSKIAGPLAAAALWERAEDAARHAGSYRGQALAGMAAAVAAADPDRAADLARQAESAARALSDSFWRTNALAGVAVAVDAVDPTQALRLAGEVERAISGGEGQPWPAGKITEVLASHGERGRAEHFARILTDPGNRALAIAGISGVLAGAGRWDEAIATARALTSHPPYLALPLARIARLLAPTSERALDIAAEAERAARAVPDDGREAMLASAAAELTAPLGQPESPNDRRLRAAARRLLALAFTCQSWYVALPGLGAVAPDAITAVYEKLIASWPGDHSFT